MKRVGIVVVTHNSEEVIGECLTAATRLEADTVVVDNASTDRTCDRVRDWPEVRLLAESRNTGFAAAANRGAGALDTELILLLNPDAVIVTPLDPLIEAFQAADVGAAGGRLVSPDGVVQLGFQVRRFPTVAALACEALGVNRLWPGNPVNRRYRCLDLNPDREADVEQPAGAFLMVRRARWAELGGMDEGFWPLWFEEVDFLRRLHEQGSRVRYIPAAVAVHRGAHSLRRLRPECRAAYWYASLLRYAAKHFSPRGWRTVCVAVAIGSLLRMVAGVLVERTRDPIPRYWGVFRMAGRYLLGGRRVAEGGLPAVTATG